MKITLKKDIYFEEPETVTENAKIEYVTNYLDGWGYRVTVEENNFVYFCSMKGAHSPSFEDLINNSWQGYRYPREDVYEGKPFTDRRCVPVTFYFEEATA